MGKAIVARTNALRKDEGREPVAVNTALAETARTFAEFMAKNDLYGHTANGKTPPERAKINGYDYCIVLENIAYAFDSRGFSNDKLTDDFVTGWKNSPGHRRNMLDRDATETGVGVARSEKTGHYYAVQVFGRPKSAAIAFTVANKSGAEVKYSVGDAAYTLPARYSRTHTICRPAEVMFQWPDESKSSVKPAGGEQYAVTKDGEKFQVAKE